MKTSEIIENLKRTNADNRYFKEVFEQEEYAPSQVYGKATTVIDVGALFGEYCFFMYDLADKLYAIEPEAKAYGILEENCKNLPKIKTFNLALSNIDGERFLEDEQKEGGHHTEINKRDGNHAVEAKTLATFMKENKIKEVSVLKIDIEGHEQDVFLSPDFKDVAHKIKLIIGEHLDTSIELLESYGFTWEKVKKQYIFIR